MTNEGRWIPRGVPNHYTDPKAVGNLHATEMERFTPYLHHNGTFPPDIELDTVSYADSGLEQGCPHYVNSKQ